MQFRSGKLLGIFLRTLVFAFYGPFCHCPCCLVIESVCSVCPYHPTRLMGMKWRTFWKCSVCSNLEVICSYWAPQV